MDSLATPVEKVRPSMLVGRTMVHPSSTNPRSRFDEASLKELAASMAPPVGIIEPLVVRPHPTKGEGRYEIVAGERRWRAAGIAGIDEIPIIVRDLDDAQVLDLQLIENKHRDDIHPLEEARAMERRIKLDRQLTPKGMAKFIGVSERYVQNRLRYLTLTGEAQKLFLDGQILSAHADLLIRLSADDQKLALKNGLYGREWNPETEKDEQVLRSARDFDLWLRENVRLKVDVAAQSGLFPELADAVATVIAPAKEGDPVARLYELTARWHYNPAKGETPPYPLGNEFWKELKKGEKCDHMARGVIVIGTGQGRVLDVCVGHGKCKKHFAASIPPPATVRPAHDRRSKPPAQKSTPSAFDREQARQREAHKLWDLVEKPVMAALTKAAKTAKPTPATLQLLAAYGEKPKTFGELLAGHLETETYGLDEARKAAKVLRVDLTPVIEASAPVKAKPAKKTIAKKAGKKIAGGRKKK